MRHATAGVISPRALHPSQAAALCLGPCKQPLPTHKHRGLPGGVDYGGVAGTTELVSELAPVREWAGMHHTPLASAARHPGHA